MKAKDTIKPGNGNGQDSIRRMKDEVDLAMGKLTVLANMIVDEGAKGPDTSTIADVMLDVIEHSQREYAKYVKY